MNGLYPTPPPAKMEKFRRKWYKKTLDPDFDIDFVPESEKPKKTQARSAPYG